MWCAPDNATVTEWYDAGGARHRKFVLAPQPGLTSDMVTWYTAGLSSPVIEYEGAKVSVKRGGGVSGGGVCWLNG